MLTAPRDWRFTAVLRSSLETPDVQGVRGEVSAQITVLHGEKKYVLKEGGSWLWSWLLEDL